MKVVFQLARFCLAAIAVGCMFYAYQYSMSQGIHTVIASQPPAPALTDPPSFNTFKDCDLVPLYGKPARPCNFEFKPPVIEAAPIQTMSKRDSEKATLWFLLAGLAWPLTLGGAAVAGYLLLKDL